MFGRERKRAWFLFQKSILYWFSKEQDPSGDFRKHVEGVVKLAFYNVNVVSENSFEVRNAMLWLSIATQVLFWNIIIP